MVNGVRNSGFSLLPSHTDSSSRRGSLPFPRNKRSSSQVLKSTSGWSFSCQGPRPSVGVKNYLVRIKTKTRIGMGNFRPSQSGAVNDSSSSAISIEELRHRPAAILAVGEKDHQDRN